MNNPYSSPKSSIEAESFSSNPLATRWSRLFAYLIDVVVIFIIMAVVGLVIPNVAPDFVVEQENTVQNVLIGLFAVSVYFLVNVNFLIRSGQTIGKKILKIRIVTNQGYAASFTKNILPRYAVFLLPSIFPFIGPIVSTVDSLFIFSNDKKCIHDLAASTKVVKC